MRKVLGEMRCIDYGAAADVDEVVMLQVTIDVVLECSRSLW